MDVQPAWFAFVPQDREKDVVIRRRAEQQSPIVASLGYVPAKAWSKAARTARHALDKARIVPREHPE